MAPTRSVASAGRRRLPLLLALPLPLAALLALAPRRAEPRFRGETLGYWVEQLDDLDPDVQGVAAFAAGRFGPRAESAVPALVRIARGDDVTREASPIQSLAGLAAQALGAIGVAAPEVVVALGQVARRPASVSQVQREAARAAILALGRLGERAAAAVPDLLSVLERPLARHESPLEALAPLQREAARALGEIGPAAASAVPALRRAMASPQDPLLALAARQALDRIEGAPRK